MRVHHCADIGAGFVELAVNAGFIGRRETAIPSEFAALEIGKDDIGRCSEKKAGFLFAPAADQHGFAVAAARADVSRSLFEQTELGKYPARQSNFLSERGIRFRILDFRCFALAQHSFWISDYRSPS